MSSLWTKIGTKCLIFIYLIEKYSFGVPQNDCNNHQNAVGKNKICLKRVSCLDGWPIFFQWREVGRDCICGNIDTVARNYSSTVIANISYFQTKWKSWSFFNNKIIGIFFNNRIKRNMIEQCEEKQRQKYQINNALRRRRIAILAAPNHVRCANLLNWNYQTLIMEKKNWRKLKLFKFQMKVIWKCEDETNVSGNTQVFANRRIVRCTFWYKCIVCMYGLLTRYLSLCSVSISCDMYDTFSLRPSLSTLVNNR